jgi:cysteine desulfurase
MTNPHQPIYLDHNATTPVHPEVLEAMLPYLREHFGNPSSGHVYGERARRAVDRAREQVAALLGCEADEIVLTSGGTESNNLAIRGVAEASDSARRHLVSSLVEHPATVEPCSALERQGFALDRVGVGPDGRVVASEVDALLRNETLLVTIMLAQNETGVLMPVREIAEAAHARGALMHTDAAQAVGKIATHVRDLGVDLLSIAGHKLYAPKGVGALYVRRGVALAPLLRGAGHERGLRPGTENVPHVVALGAACELARRDLDAEAARITLLRDELERLLDAACGRLQLNGHRVERLPNTLNVSFPGVRGTALLAAAPGVAASTGSACHAGNERPSSVLLDMGLGPERALRAVRLSLGRATASADVARAAEMLARAWRALPRRAEREPPTGCC